MHTLSIPQFKSMISHIAIRMNEPIWGHGQPGCGKTEAVYQAATEHNALVVDIRLGQYDSVDLRGFPGVDEATNTTVWYMPSTLPFKGNPKFDTPENKGRTIVLFFDEATHAVPSVFGVMMQLVNERRVGEHELMDEVRIVCAGNRAGDKAVGNKVPTTIDNRVTHAEIILDPDAWCFHAQEQDWPAIGIAFIQFRKNLLSTFEKDCLKDGKKAFATPRSWEKALRYFADTAMPADIKQAAIAGAIGQGPAAEFWGFADVWGKMISMDDIEKDPMGVKLPEEASMRYAVTVAVSGTMTPANIAPFHAFLMRLDPEFSILAWQLALQRDSKITATKEFIAFSKAYQAVFARD